MPNGDPVSPYWQCDWPWQDSVPQQIQWLGRADILAQHAWISESQWLATAATLEARVHLVRECARQTQRRPVLCLDTNPYFSRDIVDDLDRELDPDHYRVLTGNVWDLWSSRSNVAYWPSFLISQQQLANQQPVTRQGRISFISRIARPHRVALWAQVRDLVQPDDWVQVNAITEGLDRPDARWAALPWTNRPSESAQLEPRHGNLHHNGHPAYACCVNITGETDTRSGMVLLTEKTWKAYRSGCMVINYGSADTPDLLERLGLWIWPGGDPTLPTDSKIATIQQVFRAPDVVDQYHHWLPEIQHNRDLVESRSFAQHLAQAALDKLA